MEDQTAQNQNHRAAPLIEWFESDGRDLPWRQTRDPWTILVSETMLQQTQVSRVVDRLSTFLHVFPSPTALAATSAGHVIAQWSGLGYNRRAVQLHGAATAIEADHGGAVPSDLKGLLELPGVGPYTARAVLVFAYEQPEAVVDTNIGRVLARWQNRSLTPSGAQKLADSFVSAGSSWSWNQAIMELGALLCRKQPDCASCPVSFDCGWFQAGRPHPDPARGSAAVSKPQSRFEGSDRQGRAALIRALLDGPLTVERLPEAMGWPDDKLRTQSVLKGLVADGLVVEVNEQYQLPQ